MLRDGSWLLLSLYILLFDQEPLGLEMWLGPRRSQ
jgi:hypothetical protein